MARKVLSILSLAAGSVGAPALNFGDATTGFYRDGADRISLSIGAEKVVGFSSGSITISKALDLTGPWASLSSNNPSFDVIATDSGSQAAVSVRNSSGVSGYMFMSGATQSNTTQQNNLCFQVFNHNINFYTLLGGSNTPVVSITSVGDLEAKYKLSVVGTTKLGGYREYGQYTSVVSARNSGASFEWGHWNSAGYGSTLGANAGSGAPYVAFNAGQGTMANTFKTLGRVGLVIISSSPGNVSFSSVDGANADDQPLTEQVRIVSVAGAANALCFSGGTAPTITTSAGDLVLTSVGGMVGIARTPETNGGVLQVRQGISAFGTSTTSGAYVGAVAHDYVSGPSWSSARIQHWGKTTAGYLTYLPSVLQANVASLEGLNLNALTIHTNNAAPIVFGTNSLERLRIGTDGMLTGSATASGDYGLLETTAASSESAVRLNATQSTSGISLKLSNSGSNWQTSLRLGNTGNLDFYTGQTAGQIASGGGIVLRVVAHSTANQWINLYGDRNNGPRIVAGGAANANLYLSAGAGTGSLYLYTNAMGSPGLRLDNTAAGNYLVINASATAPQIKTSAGGLHIAPVTPNVGINIAPNPVIGAHVYMTGTTAASTEFGTYSQITLNAASGAQAKFGLSGAALPTTGYTGSGVLCGVTGTYLQTASALSVTIGCGVYGYASSSYAGTCTYLIGVRGIVANPGAVTNSFAASFLADDTAAIGSVWTASYYAGATAGTNKFAFYAPNDAQNYFGGPVSIGGVISSPSGPLRLSSITEIGTATADFLTLYGSTGNGIIEVSGSSAGASLQLKTKGLGTVQLYSGAYILAEFESVGSTANYIKFNPNAGGNPRIYTSGGNLVLGGGSALATNATTGHIMIPTCAGAPTGAPSSAGAGQLPLIYDTTNNKLYAYNGAWKSSAAFT